MRAGLRARSVWIVDPEGRPTIDEANVVRSVQAADVSLSRAQLEALWSHGGLAHLAGNYWRFLGRISLGLIGVEQTATERRIVVRAGRRPILLAFERPTYELDAERGVVRWPIRGGLLAAGDGRPTGGVLELAMRRLPAGEATTARIAVEVTVLGFVPALAERFGRRVYTATQSRVHVFVSHAFLRSLGRLDLTTPGEG